MTTFYGRTLGDAVQKSLAAERKNSTPERHGFERKGRFQIWAPPGAWGIWLPIWAQFGVVGSGASTSRTIVKVSFDTQTQAPSSIEVRVKGGDRIISGIGPGYVKVPVTGNVATELSIQCRSLSLGQNVFVTV